MKKYFLILCLLAVLVPSFVFAATPGTVNNDTLKNPLKSGYDSIPDFIEAVIEDIVIPIGFTVVVFFIIYSGFLFVTAAGNETTLEKAKKSILYAVIGAAILLGAWAIAKAIDATIKSLTATSYLIEKNETLS